MSNMVKNGQVTVNPAKPRVTMSSINEKLGIGKFLSLNDRKDWVKSGQSFFIFGTTVVVSAKYGIPQVVLSIAIEPNMPVANRSKLGISLTDKDGIYYPYREEKFKHVQDAIDESGQPLGPVKLVKVETGNHMEAYDVVDADADEIGETIDTSEPLPFD